MKTLMLALGLATGVWGCSDDPPASTDSTTSSTTAVGGGGSGGSTGSTGGGGVGGGGVTCQPDVAAPNEELPGAGDPTGGVFSMEDALAELPEGPGPLRAVIATDKGELTCELFPDKAPNAVANFVGLARGRRPWKDGGKWVKRKLYDGLTFHRVIPMFMAQGGDPLGTGYGGPGYKFADEISDLNHEAGTLAYANSGPNSNGSQFYITEVATPFLDGDYTTFGRCTPVSVVVALTGVPRDAKDKPLEPLLMNSVTLTRCKP